MRASLLVVAFILAILPLAWSGDTQPSKMTHIIMKMEGTGISKNSFAANPRSCGERHTSTAEWTSNQIQNREFTGE